MQWTDLCNRALSRLGTNLIASFSDGSNNAQYCLLHYQAVLEALLSKADWAWARKRTTLASLFSAPEFGYAYAYQLPGDFIRPCQVVDEYGHSRPAVETDGSSWGLEVLEGSRVIATDSEYLYLAYIARPDDPSIMPESFASAYVGFLAAELSVALARSESIRSLLIQEAMLKERQALAENGEMADDQDRVPWFQEAR